jgi:D-alanyl-lipoteichoic acid acyltransferase DltB (MBOAT superfamily)
MFYGFWRLDFLALVIFTAWVDYTAGRRIAASESTDVRRFWLVGSLAMNIAVLVFFKYTYFLTDSTFALAHMLGIEVSLDVRRVIDIVLPLGLSFYTFQSMSYTIDVYRGVQTPVNQFSLFLTYVMLWPQLVAGPILRTSEVVPQLTNYRRPKVGEISYGLEEILQGLFKKLVLADTIAPLVDEGFGIPVDHLGMLDVWTLAFAFGFQIYYDFSGYSQIALGSARVLGFQFPRNFNWPYLATSPRDFWRRWHISLSTWIRDYLYLPIQGSKFRATSEREADPSGVPAVSEKVTEWRRSTSLVLTWVIMGLWHGASWTFAAWGLWHATLVLLHRLLQPICSRLPMFVRVVGGWGLTLAFSMLGWIYFRAPDMATANAMIFRAFDVRKLSTMSMRENDYLITFLYMTSFLLAAGLVVLNTKKLIPAWLRFAGLLMAQAVMFTLVFLLLRQAKSFIYFNF